MSSAPIRVGLIGLSSNTGTMVPGLWGAQAHLPYLRTSPHYKLTAIANSTVESAQKSITTHNLDSTVKAYGSPTDIANDPNVDLVVVAVNVEKHFMLTKPALLANKSIFVEWPLGANTAEAIELANLAKEHNLKTVVGLQGRTSPVVQQVKHLIDSGAIGKVVSTTVNASFSGPGFPLGIWMKGAEYYLDINAGGNSYSIFFAHFLDSFTHVLGDFSTIKAATLRNDIKSVNVMDMSTHEIVEEGYPKSSPDDLQIHGLLEGGASASIAYSSSSGGSIDGKGYRWRIVGTEGAVEVLVEDWQWQMTQEGVEVRVKKGMGEVEVVGLGVEGEGQAVKGVSDMGRNTARLYEEFGTGAKGDRVYADFEDAVKLHKLLDEIRRVAGW